MGWTARGSNPRGGRDFSQTDPNARPASYTLDTGFFPRVNPPGPKFDHSPYLALKLKKEYSYTSTSFLGLNGLFGVKFALQQGCTNPRHQITVATKYGLALPIWRRFILFRWIKNSNHIFEHLVPQGTPTILITFMVVIETISNLIRPGTIAVRLTI
jgi:hypothetical protein